MTKDTILIAVLLCVGFTFAQSTLAEVPLGWRPDTPTDADKDIDMDIGAPVALYELLELSESQLASLKQVDSAREDEIFPLLREAWEKSWDLMREFRREPPDTAIVNMILADIEGVRQRIYVVNARHREMAKTYLNPTQFSTLADIEMAAELMEVAQEAIDANLVAAPDHHFGGIPEFGFFGIPGFGLFDGFFGSILDGSDNSDSLPGEPVEGR